MMGARGNTYAAIEIMTKLMDYGSNQEVEVMANVNSFDKTCFNCIEMETVDLNQIGVDFPVYFGMYPWVAILVFEGSDNIYDWECHRKKVYNAFNCPMVILASANQKDGKFKQSEKINLKPPRLTNLLQ